MLSAVSFILRQWLLKFKRLWRLLSSNFFIDRKIFYEMLFIMSGVIFRRASMTLVFALAEECPVTVKSLNSIGFDRSWNSSFAKTRDFIHAYIGFCRHVCDPCKAVFPRSRLYMGFSRVIKYSRFLCFSDCFMESAPTGCCDLWEREFSFFVGSYRIKEIIL